MQNDKLGELKNRPQQAKQMNELLGYVNDAIKAEMPVYRKLIQFDVMNQIQKKAVADGIKDAKAANLTTELDGMLTQIFKDIEKQLTTKCASLK